MQKANFTLLIIVMSMLLCVCESEPTIDASTDYSLRESIEKVRKSLSEKDRAEFDEAVRTVAFSNIDLTDVIAGSASLGNLPAQVREALDGKSASEILQAADSVKSDRAARERQQAMSEIEELEEKAAQVETAKQKLRKFEIIRSRFYKREREFLGDQPVIELTVRNGLSQAVSRVYFSGTLASPDRSVPWLKDDFNYSIPGGIEPGEEATWYLASNMFSDWGNVKAPADAVLTVEVVQVDGANNDPLFSTRSFTEYEQERLRQLREKYSDD